MERARSSARSAQGNYQRLLTEQPLVVGALAIATGAALGAMFPRTQGENRALGDISDQQKQALKHKAEGMAESAEDKVQGELHRQQGDIGGAGDRSSAAGATDPRGESHSPSTPTQGQSAASSAPYNPPAGASGHPGSVQGGTAGHEPPPPPRESASPPNQPGNKPHYRP